MSSPVMYAAIAGLSLATASALPARNLLKKPDLDDFLKDSDSPQDEYESETKTKTNYQSASASCSVSTYTDKYSGYVDEFVYAVVDVYKHACDGWSYEYFYDAMYGWAEVWAGATAAVSVNCNSYATESGDASGCGFGSASAQASNLAFVDAYARATVEVIDDGHCSCGNENIWAEVQASLYQVITADAYAKAKAAACVEGNDYAEASAYVDCYASVWTQLFAEAAASVIIDGSCYAGNYADLHAFVDSFSVETESCTKIIYSSPGGKGEGKGGADTSS